MNDINSEIVEIGGEVRNLAVRITAEFQARGIDPKKDYVKGAAWINFTLGTDYHEAAQEALLRGNVISGTSLTRTQLENAADLFYILGEPTKVNRRAKAYVDSIDLYRDAMLNLGEDTMERLDERPGREVNSWTTASIYDRLRATGDSLVFTYDMFSYYSHPNPAAMIMLLSKPYKEMQTNVIQQANEYAMLNIIALTLTHSDISSVTMDEVDQLAQRLGYGLVAPAR